MKGLFFYVIKNAVTMNRPYNRLFFGLTFGAVQKPPIFYLDFMTKIRYYINIGKIFFGACNG